jgi:hypothetical protein
MALIRHGFVSTSLCFDESVSVNGCSTDDSGSNEFGSNDFDARADRPCLSAESGTARPGSGNAEWEIACLS